MDLKKSKRLLIWLAVVYWVFAIGVYAAAYPQFRHSPVIGEKLTAETIVGELLDGNEYRQEMVSPCDVLETINVMTITYDRENTGFLVVTILDAEGAVRSETTVPVSQFANYAYSAIQLDEPVYVGAGEKVTVALNTQQCTYGDSITIYVAGSTDLQKETANYYLNGVEASGTLCIQLGGYNNIMFYITYVFLVIAVFLLLLIYTMHCWKKAKEGQYNLVVAICVVFSRYGFLVKQLVAREFKMKYKRSVLGMAWSVMNPVLTMTVQYIVFSAVFRSDIQYYPVYLLTGIVFFNFFSESVALGMLSILGNAALIKKVYMPKYIYPVSKIVTALINFGLALLPLAAVILLSGLSFKLSMLLVLFDVVCLLLFVAGLTFLLATATTYFLDVQFLWSVVSMMWMYMTPLFYPESIIPKAYLGLYRMNPLYQFITFARTCIIEGISPAPSSYFLCLFFGLGMFAIGALTFKKHQDGFVLHL